MLRKILVLSLLVVLLGPTEAALGETAATARRKRDQARQRRAEVAAKLNALQASDGELERAVATLNARVRTVSAQAASARQAVTTAEAEVGRAERLLTDAQLKADGIQGAVKARAVASYMRPTHSSWSAITGARSLDEASRRQLLVSQVANNDRDSLDELRAVREDVAVQREVASAAREKAAARARQVNANLRELEKTRADKVRLERALESRISSFQAEADALSREETALAAVIRQREVRARASRSDAGAAGTDGGRVSGAGLIWPVRGTVTSEFGSRWGRRHEGIDIAAPTGTPIRAAKAGTVIFVGQQGGYGNITIVDHGSGLSTTYPHQSRFGTSEGADVAQGEVIGYVGCTGSCTGPHLHFETRVGGSAVNPRRYLP
jgi:murein DD-endopeptidase MepM/ murein hydrolase activator NlpD